MSVQIRVEKLDDLDQIRAVELRAFGQPAEANVVDRLREAGQHVLSLVAEREKLVVGHVLFSEVTIHRDGEPAETGLGLGPIAVLPELQRQGVGSALIEAGLERISADRPDGFIVVLGDPKYYSRFGFKPAAGYGLTLPFSVPPEAFQILLQGSCSLPSGAGIVHYRPEFAEADGS